MTRQGQGAPIVWLASYPKSGNTWLRILLGNALSGREDPIDIDELPYGPEARILYSAVEDLTLADARLLSDRELDLLWPVVARAMAKASEPGPALAKVHDAWRTNEAGEPILGSGVARGAIYMVRDPRDVVVSKASYYGITARQSMGLLDDIGNRIGPRGQVPQRLLDWSGHVLSWLQQRELPVCLVRYEDLHADTAAVLEAVVAFAGLDASPGAIERAVAFSRFEALRQREASHGFHLSLPQSTAPFFRAGEIGSWRRVLSPEQAAAIVARHGAVMERLGYV